MDEGRGVLVPVVRVHKGRRDDPAAFETLTDDPSDRHSFVMLQSDFSGLEGGALLDAIGFKRAYVKEKLETGFEFSVLEFSTSILFRADWAGVERLFKERYGEVGVEPALWREIQRSDFSALFPHWDSIRQQGKQHPEYLQVNRLSSPQIQDVRTLRQVLFFELGMRSLFSGDGFAYDEQGRRGVAEFLTPNVPRTALEDLKVSPLSI